MPASAGFSFWPLGLVFPGLEGWLKNKTTTPDTKIGIFPVFSPGKTQSRITCRTDFAEHETGQDIVDPAVSKGTWFPGNVLQVRQPVHALRFIFTVQPSVADDFMQVLVHNNDFRRSHPVLDNLFTENRGSGRAVANAAAAAALPVFYFAKRSCCGMINKTNG